MVDVFLIFVGDQHHFHPIPGGGFCRGRQQGTKRQYRQKRRQAVQWLHRLGSFCNSVMTWSIWLKRCSILDMLRLNRKVWPPSSLNVFGLLWTSLTSTNGFMFVSAANS